MRRRAVHPAAWWLWALALAVVALRTTNPLLLALVAAVAWSVVVARRTDAPWSASFGSFLRMGVFVVVLRLVFQVLFSPRVPGHEVFTLPSVDLPAWLSGLSLGGPVTSEALFAALYGGMQLAVVLLCVGAANSLASPHRLLRCLPTVLYEAGVVVTVALSFAPSASASALQVQEARRLRGRPHRGPSGWRGLAVPVLEGALERSIHLAASMDSRGYGRRTDIGTGRRLLSNALLGAGATATAVGAYVVLDGGGSQVAGSVALVGGVLLLGGALFLGATRSKRTRYRPDPWAAPEWVTTLAGVAALAAVLATAHLGWPGLATPTSPLEAPSLPWLATAGVVVALLPAFATPDPVP